MIDTGKPALRLVVNNFIVRLSTHFEDQSKSCSGGQAPIRSPGGGSQRFNVCCC